MAKKRTTLTIKGIGVLDAPCDTYLGQVIDYVKQTPFNQNNKGIAIEMLFARFLLLVLERNSPSNRAIAIECAIKCETWAKVIREVWGLNEPTSTYPTVYSLPQIDRALPLTSSPEAEIIETKELTSEELTAKAKELEQFEQMLIETIESSSSVWEAKDKLVEIQPQEESDWTEAQWEMWDEYITKQENIIDQELLGDLADRLKGGSDRLSEGGEVKG